MTLKDGAAAMSVAEFAKWVGISRTTAWGLIKSGSLRAVKIGRRTLVRADDAKIWLDQCPLVKNSHNRGAK